MISWFISLVHNFLMLKHMLCGLLVILWSQGLYLQSHSRFCECQDRPSHTVLDTHAVIYIKWTESRSVVFDSLRSHGYSPWNFLGQNTGVGSISLLQGIFSTQGSNPGLPHCRLILYQLSQEGSPVYII